MGDGEDAVVSGSEDGRLVGEIVDSECQDRAVGNGGSSPKRLMSAFENGRSQAKPLSCTNQVGRPYRVPSMTSGSAVIRSFASSSEATGSR